VIEMKRCGDWERKGDGWSLHSVSRVLDTEKLEQRSNFRYQDKARSTVQEGKYPTYRR
jgi:hypothetical protein